MPVGTRGIPPGWQGHKWGNPKYDFAVVQDGAGKALRLKSDNDSSTISKEIKVDVKQYPILEWKWKVVALPPRGDARKADTDDEAAQLYVTFPRFPSAVRSRIIGYIWDSTEPAGASFQSAKVSTVHFIVVRSGERRPRPVDHGDGATCSRTSRRSTARSRASPPAPSPSPSIPRTPERARRVPLRRDPLQEALNDRFRGRR